jgi:Phosphoserine phosphatase RsbU, N-terminal domain
VRRITTFVEAYGAAFDSFLRGGGESSLHAAYQLGREAVQSGLGIPDLARVHHEVMLNALRQATEHDTERITLAGADFLAESVSAYEMVRRGFEEARERADLERRHAMIIRRLTALLADTALVDSMSSLRETLELVAETACELTRASGCTVSIESFDKRGLLEVSSGEASGSGAPLIASFTAWGGEPMGSLRVVSQNDGRFTDVDEAVLMQLGQMTAAAVERCRLYREASSPIR